MHLLDISNMFEITIKIFGELGLRRFQDTDVLFFPLPDVSYLQGAGSAFLEPRGIHPHHTLLTLPKYALFP